MKKKEEQHEIAFGTRVPAMPMRDIRYPRKTPAPPTTLPSKKSAPAVKIAFGSRVPPTPSCQLVGKKLPGFKAMAATASNKLSDTLSSNVSKAFDDLNCY